MIIRERMKHTAQDGDSVRDRMKYATKDGDNSRERGNETQ